MAIDIIKHRDSSLVFDSLLNSIERLAGTSYRDNEPFIYNDGKREIACLVDTWTITLLYN